MKKRIISILILIVTMFVPQYYVSAASASASIKVSTSNTVVGNSGTATLTISADVPIAQVWGTFSCGGLGKQDLSYSATSSPGKSKSYTINWKAAKTGTYTCEVTGLEVGILDGSDTGAWPSVSVSPKTIKVVSASTQKPSGGGTSSSGNSSSGGNSSNGGTTADKPTYSSDNNLKSLSIDGYELTPKFDKNTIEYKLTLDQSIEKIKINASANHEKAKVNGTGEFSLSNGENTFEIKVTAENGNEKKYKIIVMVSDLNPIKVKVGEEELTIVKKNNDLIPKLEYYDEKTITIDNQEVVAYENTNTKVTLVLLKDTDNKINYYIYNKNENTYTKYRYITIGGVTLQLLDNKNNLENYKKYDLELQDEKIDFYKIKGSHKVGLIYGTNVKTGNTSYYVYDKNEETLSKYYDEEINIYKNKIDDLKNFIMILIGSISFVAIIIVVKSLKKKKMINKSRYNL